MISKPLNLISRLLITWHYSSSLEWNLEKVRLIEKRNENCVDLKMSCRDKKIGKILESVTKVQRTLSNKHWTQENIATHQFKNLALISRFSLTNLCICLLRISHKPNSIRCILTRHSLDSRQRDKLQLIQDVNEILAPLQRPSRAVAMAARASRWNWRALSMVCAGFEEEKKSLRQRRAIEWIFMTFRMIRQPRFPKMTRNHVHQFYHACIYDKDETKKAFNRYVEVRQTSQYFFLSHTK